MPTHATPRVVYRHRFASMTITLTGKFLFVRAGIGLVRKAVALDRVEHVEVTRSRRIEGWGVQGTRRGTLYDVSGLDAVRVVLTFGGDDATRLAATLRHALAARRG